MPRRYGRRPLSRAARLTKEWFGMYTFDANPDIPNTIGLAPNTVFMDWVFSPGDALDILDEPTVLRILVNVGAAFDLIAASGIALMSWGFLATRDDGFSGLPPIRDPMADSHMDWIAWGTHTAIAPASANVASAGQYLRRESIYDGRAKRKIDPGEGLAFYAGYSAGGYPANIRIHMNRRIRVAH